MFSFQTSLSSATLTPAIKSVQVIAITMSSAQTSNTATIDAVDVNRSVLLYNGVLIDDNASSQALLSGLVLTNSTTVTATRNSSLSVSVTVNAVVVEFNRQFVDSVQSGIVDLNGVASNTDTINSVDVSRTIAVFSGQTTSVNTIDRSLATIKLTDATTVTGEKGDATDDMDVYYYVVEFSPLVVDSIQQVALTLDDPDISVSQTIASVDMDRTATIFQGNRVTASRTADIYAPLIYLNSATEVTAERNTSDTAVSVIVQAVIVEFTPQIIHQIQRGRATIAVSNDQADVTIDMVDISKSLSSYLGFKTSSSSHLEDDIYPNSQLINATTLRLERGDVPSNSSVTASWEVISFK